jgi:fluoride exporter
VPAARTSQDAPASDAPRRLLAIALGGALGTLARYGMDRAVVGPPFGFPWATFAVNVVGSFLLGVIVTVITGRWPTTRFARPFAAIGFCGGFTTFSTLMVEVAQRGQHGRALLAAGYLVITLVAGFLAVLGGITVARARLTPLPAAGIPDPDDIGDLGGSPTR